MREKKAPKPAAPPTPKPGTRMLVIPPDSSDPMRLAEESIEKLGREQPPRAVKTNKKKPARGGGIGGGRP